MSRILFFLPVCAFAGFAVVALWMMWFGDGDDLPSALIGKPTPVVQIELMEGQTPFDTSDLATGQVALVNFWASWCAPCRAEHPMLMDMAASGVPIFGVNYKDAPGAAAAFLAELGSPYGKGGADPRAKMALDWGVYGLPETFVIGPDGTVLARVTGPVTQRNLETRVMPALQAKGLTLPNK